MRALHSCRWCATSTHTCCVYTRLSPPVWAEVTLPFFCDSLPDVGQARAALAQVEHVRDALVPRQQSAHRMAAPWLFEGSEGMQPSSSSATSRAAENPPSLPPTPPVAPPLTSRSALSSLFEGAAATGEGAGSAMGGVLSPSLLAPRIVPQGRQDAADGAGDPSWLFRPVAQAPGDSAVAEHSKMYSDYKDGGLATLPLQSGATAASDQTEPGSPPKTAARSSLFADEEQDDSWLNPVEV